VLPNDKRDVCLLKVLNRLPVERSLKVDDSDVTGLNRFFFLVGFNLRPMLAQVL
jgi:hypothetical protein